MANRIPSATLDPVRDQSAKEAAYARVSWPVNLAPASVSYHSHGHLLIVGNEADIRLAARQLLEGENLGSISLLVTEATPIAASDSDAVNQAYEQTAALPCYQARRLRLDGYLGAFRVEIDLGDGQDGVNLARACIDREHFDLIMDLGSMAQLDLQLPPPGYHAAHWGSAAFNEALEAVSDSIGEFEKPKYFQIDNALCAHAERGKTGCTRCLDVCPADAISSVTRRVESWIEIDPYLCHGAGSCTSACPTGAIQYLLPQPQRQLDYVTRILDSYRQAGGSAPVIRFADRQWLEAEDSPAAGHILDVPLEELGAAGQEHWLAALADGAAEVRIQLHDQLPATLTALINDQIAQTQALLAALGHDPQRITVIPADVQARDRYAERDSLIPRDSQGLALDEGKRERINTLIDYLAAQGRPSGAREPLPRGAPFGAVIVEESACTLCMACVAVCPTSALAGGDDHSPMLSFREADCVQCGLCDSACPENAITLQPGFLADLERRSARQTCKEEPPFECITCGKPFATTSTINNIKAKLADHAYFAGDAMHRLEMCEDCRVKDVWRELAHDPHAQMKV